MAIVGDVIETFVDSTIYSDAARGMVPGRTFTRRHYIVSSCGRDFTVQKLYKDGDFHIVVHVHGGRDFRVGSAETPTIDDAVAAALSEARGLGLEVGISEEMTHAHHMAVIDRGHAAIDAEIAHTQIWDD